jgi:hypothetical protein
LLFISASLRIFHTHARKHTHTHTYARTCCFHQTSNAGLSPLEIVHNGGAMARLVWPPSRCLPSKVRGVPIVPAVLFRPLAVDRGSSEVHNLLKWQTSLTSGYPGSTCRALTQPEKNKQWRPPQGDCNMDTMVRVMLEQALLRWTLLFYCAGCNLCVSKT